MCHRADIATGDIAGGNLSAFAGAEECGGSVVSKERIQCLLFARQTEYGFDVQISRCVIQARQKIRKMQHISVCVYAYGVPYEMRFWGKRLFNRRGGVRLPGGTWAGERKALGVKR